MNRIKNNYFKFVVVIREVHSVLLFFCVYYIKDIIMAAEFNLPIELHSGDKWDFSIELYNDDDSPATGYTGYTLTMDFKQYASDDEPVIRFSGDSATINGHILRFTKSSDDTNIDGYDYNYDIQLTDELGDNFTPYIGIASVKSDITRT